MSYVASPKPRLLLAVLAAVLTTAMARAEESNRNEVRANLERDGWSVIWGKNFTEYDWARGTAAIAQSVAAENPGPFLEWFGQTLEENFNKLQHNLEGVSRRDLDRWVLQSLREKQIIVYRGLQIEAGFATYDRWNRVVYDEPRTRKISTPPFFETYLERVERRANLPNWHQFYVRYRLVGGGGNGPNHGGAPGNGSPPSVVEIRYSIANDSGRTVHFHMQPSGRKYSLEPRQTFRGMSHQVNGKPPTITLEDSGHTYRLKEGHHKLWWMRDEQRIGLDIEGR